MNARPSALLFALGAALLSTLGPAAAQDPAGVRAVGPAAQAHSVAEKLLIVLVALHVLAALAQHFWFKTDVLKRMLGSA